MRSVLAVGVPLAFFGLFALSVWYVGSRLPRLFGTTRRWPIRTGVAATSVGALVAVGVTTGTASAQASVVNVLAGWVFTFHLLLFFSLLGLHVLPLRSNTSRKQSAAAALALALVATGAGALWAESLTVAETAIRLPGLERAVTVMQISDVHLGPHRGRAWLARIVEETNRFKPDLVLITGDLIDARSALEPGVLDPLADLAAPALFVGGNHEKMVDAKRAFDLIGRQGVRVLHNEVVETHGLRLVGLDYMNADEKTFDMHPSDDPRTVKSVLAGLPLRRDLPAVLLHHSPVGVPYVAAKGIGLMISGHTHAGQVFPFTLLSRLPFPLNRGVYHEGATTVFVSQGAGTFLTRVRLGTSNEINLLRLAPGT